MAEDTQNSILSKAAELFYKAGIKSVSINDICRELGMSKKTFYVYFSSKDELVQKMLERNRQNMLQKTSAAMHNYDLIECFKHIVQHTKQEDDPRCIPQLVYDLQKYYPVLFEEHQRIMLRAQHGIIVNYLNESKQKGILHEDVDVEATALLLVKLHSDLLRDMELAKEYNITLSQWSKNVMYTVIRGVLTPQAIKNVLNEDK